MIDPSTLVSEFAGQLLSHVGRRVRVYMSDGTTVTGAIANDPQVFYAIGIKGDLVTLGMFVLSRHAEDGPDVSPFLGRIEDLVTYDVLPIRRRLQPQPSDLGDGGTDAVISRNLSG